MNKIVRVPFNLDQPFWVEDSKFDLEYHVRHIALPSPGDWRQLCIQVARLHSQQLDLSKPPWQAYIIEGLNNVEGAPKGSFAVYLKLHHAAADGMAFADFYGCLHDVKPVKPNGLYGSKIEKLSISDEPGPFEIFRKTTRHLAGVPLDIAGTLVSSVPSYWKSQRAKEELDYPGTPRKPTTPFDSPVSRNRVFNGLDFAMDDIKTIRNAVPHSTLNDIAVAIVAGGLRSFLLQNFELPESSLVGMLPVNIRKVERDGHEGNAFSSMSVEIHTTIADPLKRLEAIAETNGKAKKYLEVAGDDLLIKLSRVLPARAQKYFGSLLSVSAQMGNSVMPANTTVTNVPNSPFPIYLAGARATRFFAIGLLQPGHGLCHVVSSYNNTFCISFLACREQLPDPQTYAEHMHQSFEDLKKAAGNLLSEKD